MAPSVLFLHMHTNAEFGCTLMLVAKVLLQRPLTTLLFFISGNAEGSVFQRFEFCCGAVVCRCLIQALISPVTPVEVRTLESETKRVNILR